MEAETWLLLLRRRRRRRQRRLRAESVKLQQGARLVRPESNEFDLEPI